MADAMQGKCFAVTGGASGIGRAIAERFAREGATVVVGDLNIAGAEQTAAAITAAGGQAVAAGVDVADGRSIEAFIAASVDHGGRLDGVIGAAGIWQSGTVLTIDEADWDRAMAVNAKSLYWIGRLAHSHLKETGGTIITIASISGLRGARLSGAYNMSKAALIALTRNMALDFAADGIRVNCLCPGYVDTPLGHSVIDDFGGDAVRDMFVALHPLGPGKPTDVAGAALFLASSDAAWITGSALVVDGGFTAG
jgi:NAD(P)-dependent dehydrogenase (short-subunit alcohol dehydrogenase family)